MNVDKLLQAAGCGHLEQVRYLLDHGVDVNGKTSRVCETIAPSWRGPECRERQRGFALVHGRLVRL